MLLRENIEYNERGMRLTISELTDDGPIDLITYMAYYPLRVGGHPDFIAAVMNGNTLRYRELGFLRGEIRDLRELAVLTNGYCRSLTLLRDHTGRSVQCERCNQDTIIGIVEDNVPDYAIYYSHFNPLLSPALACLGCPRSRYVVPVDHQGDCNQEINTMLVVDSRHDNPNNMVVEQLAERLGLTSTIVRWDYLGQVLGNRYDIVIIIGDILPPEHEEDFYNQIILGSQNWRPKLALLLHPSIACRNIYVDYPLGAAQAFIMNGARHCFAFRGHTPIDGAQHFLQGILRHLAIPRPRNLPILEANLNNAINHIYRNLETLSIQGRIAALSTIQLSGEVVGDARD